MRTWGSAFPHGTHGPKPDYLICHGCGEDGWGPMLLSKIWNSIVKPADNHCRYFLCQVCMEKRLGRRLKLGDLRDCPVNYHHPLYVKHGRV